MPPGQSPWRFSIHPVKSLGATRATTNRQRLILTRSTSQPHGCALPSRFQIKPACIDGFGIYARHRRNEPALEEEEEEALPRLSLLTSSAVARRPCFRVHTR